MALEQILSQSLFRFEVSHSTLHSLTLVAPALIQTTPSLPLNLLSWHDYKTMLILTWVNYVENPGRSQCLNSCYIVHCILSRTLFLLAPFILLLLKRYFLTIMNSIVIIFCYFVVIISASSVVPYSTNSVWNRSILLNSMRLLCCLGTIEFWPLLFWQPASLLLCFFFNHNT